MLKKEAYCIWPSSKNLGFSLTKITIVYTKKYFQERIASENTAHK